MVSRREAATLIGALGLGAGGVSNWKGGHAAGIEALPSDPKAQNEAQVRILGRTDEGESVWQSSSTIYALTDDGVIPLLKTEGGQRSWWKREDYSTFRRYPSALSYFVDPDTNEYIEEFLNPITGRTTPLISTVQRRQDGEVFTPEGSYFPISKDRFPDMYETKPLELDWRLDNDTIRLLLTENFAPVAPQPIYEVHTYFSLASEALDASRTTASATSSGWYTGKFSRWLDMADVDGYMIWHFEGTKLNSVDDLNPKYVQRARVKAENFDTSPEFDSGLSYIEKVEKNRKAKD